MAQRPARKQLQTENTDALWAELTYLQQENKTLKADKYKFVFSLSKIVADVYLCACFLGCTGKTQLLKI